MGLVVDQDRGHIQGDPTASLRMNFSEWIFHGPFRDEPCEFKRSVDSEPWLTEHQRQDPHDRFLSRLRRGLFMANEACQELVFKAPVDVNSLAICWTKAADLEPARP